MNPAPPAIAVVVPCLNAADDVGGQLDALERQDVDFAWELVVVDNGSDDDTASVARDHPNHPRCRPTVIHEPRRGLNVARNAGVRASVAPLIAICDADDLVTPGWLSAMTSALADADVVGGPLEVREINTQRALALRGWSRTDAPLAPIDRSLGFLQQVAGANIGFRRTLWESLGGFDERYARGGDDTDFVWRAQLAGHVVGTAPEAIVHYRARSGRRATFRQYVRDGDGTAHLYSQFRGQGMPGRSARELLGTLRSIVAAAPSLLGDDLGRQGHLLRTSGKQLGRLRGSVRHRVLYL